LLVDRFPERPYSTSAVVELEKLLGVRVDVR
jgi:hypothetical protein